jgi:membrane protein
MAAFRSSRQTVLELMARVPFLETVFGKRQFSGEILSFAGQGITGILSVASIFWAGRIFALSLQRGLKVVFSGVKKRNPLTDTLAAVFIELLILVFAAVAILCSPDALRLYGTLPPLPLFRFSRVLPFVLLAALSYCACRTVTPNPPRRLSALWGTLFFAVAYGISAATFAALFNQTRYHTLYGALGNLVSLLINVYLFFVFFFSGAQFAKTIDSFDALLFSKLRGARLSRKPADRLFLSTEGTLEKYLRSYGAGDTIFAKGDGGQEIYYLLEGEVDVLIPQAKGGHKRVSTLKAGSFFGEMGHLLSEDRTATVKAKTGVFVLALPPRLFDEILRCDTGMDRAIIEHLSRRLKTGNERLASRDSFGMDSVSEDDFPESTTPP